ncbi:ComEC/Rec2 family competence protein, partial [Anaerococcus porci]|uniref:ComEC/Rec2 family competence protein n=1 Tax=Anaerococcus porci TaxID=2652269 RepID=UPI002A75D6C7
IIFINPFAIFHASLILSYLAGFAIYIIYPKYKNKGSFIKKNLVFIGSIQLVMFPFLVYYFQSFNFLSIITNFLIVPIFQISAYLIFIIILAYPFLGKFLFIVFWSLDFLIKSIINMALFLNSIDVFKISFPKESILISIYFLIIIYLFLELKSKRLKNLRKYLIYSILIIVFSITCDLNRPISFSMIDIGQGDSFILETGKDIYLFDCGEISFGNYNSTDNILIPLLKAKGIRKIKGVFISHEDSDHYGALGKLNNEFNIEKIYVNKYNVNSFKNYNIEILHDYDRLTKKDIIIDVLENYDGEENEDSMPLLLTIKGVRILTMGDLPSNREEVVKRKADILKVSHHGSKSSTSKDFINYVRPEVALISAGRNNVYKHPSKEVLENLKDIKTYNTQTDGYVEIQFVNGGFKVEKYMKGGFFR